eukprot:gene1258-32605_t
MPLQDEAGGGEHGHSQAHSRHSSGEAAGEHVHGQAHRKHAYLEDCMDPEHQSYLQWQPEDEHSQSQGTHSRGSAGGEHGHSQAHSRHSSGEAAGEHVHGQAHHKHAYLEDYMEPEHESYQLRQPHNWRNEDSAWPLEPWQAQRGGQVTRHLSMNVRAGARVGSLAKKMFEELLRDRYDYILVGGVGISAVSNAVRAVALATSDAFQEQGLLVVAQLMSTSWEALDSNHNLTKMALAVHRLEPSAQLSQVLQRHKRSTPSTVCKDTDLFKRACLSKDAIVDSPSYEWRVANKAKRWIQAQLLNHGAVNVIAMGGRGLARALGIQVQLKSPKDLVPEPVDRAHFANVRHEKALQRKDRSPYGDSRW